MAAFSMRSVAKTAYQRGFGSYGTLVRAVALPVLAAAAIVLLVNLAAPPAVVALETTPGTTEEVPLHTPASGVAFAVGSVLSSALTFYALAAAGRADLVATGRSVAAEPARHLRTFGLLGLFYGLLTLPTLAAAFMVDPTADPAGAAAAYGIVTIAFLPVLIAVLVLGIRWALAPVLTVAEDVPGFARSWALTRGSFWRIVGATFLVVLPLLIIVAIPAAIASMALPPAQQGIAQAVTQLLGGLLFLPVFAVALVEIYAALGGTLHDIPDIPDIPDLPPA